MKPMVQAKEESKTEEEPYIDLTSMMQTDEQAFSSLAGDAAGAAGEGVDPSKMSKK